MIPIERKFLSAVERGDSASLEQLLERRLENQLDVNCCDSLARNALVLAIERRNLDIVKLLIEAGVRPKDALLHAINSDFLEAAELLLDSAGGEKWQRNDDDSFFSPDLSPLVLAAHRNNFEIIKMLFDRQLAPLPDPHEPHCDCRECSRAMAEDRLKHSRARINAYRALASPCLMALSSPDPLLSAFEMSAKLESLAKLEPEYRQDYLRLRAQCQTFAMKLLDHTRTSAELGTLLSMDRSGTALERLKLAIQCKQKTFCAHPNIQELLANMWYENLPGFRRKNYLAQVLQVICIGLMFPIYSIAYLVAPRSRLGRYIKRPFIKFICHSASYITFLMVLILASQRVEAFYCWSSLLELFSPSSSSSSPSSSSSSLGRPLEPNSTLFKQLKAPSLTVIPDADFDDPELNTLAAIYAHQYGAGPSTARGLDSLSKIFEVLPASAKRRGTPPSPIEVLILVWVLSLLWAEIKQLRLLGMNYYKDDMWNILDSVASGFYIGTIVLRVVSYLQTDEPSRGVAREHWPAYDPLLMSEGLFAAATIFSALKLVYVFSVNPYLGPLQISLGRMAVDILRFSWIYLLVLFAFACGMNQLLWYYADLERHQCLNITNYNLNQYYSAQSNLRRSTESPPDVLAAPRILESSSPTNGTASQTTPIPTLPPMSANSSDSTDERLMEAALNASLEDDSTKPPVTIDDSCKTWRHFSNVFESSQTLFWANFGLVDLENFDLTGIRQYTRFWALLMFGCYCFINVIVVLNLLIAMMNHSYVKISTQSDIEWKFARTRLWMSYFDTGSTVPAPFNIIPSLKSIRGRRKPRSSEDQIDLKAQQGAIPSYWPVVQRTVLCPTCQRQESH